MTTFYCYFPPLYFMAHICGIFVDRRNLPNDLPLATKFYGPTTHLALWKPDIFHNSGLCTYFLLPIKWCLVYSTALLQGHVCIVMSRVLSRSRSLKQCLVKAETPVAHTMAFFCLVEAEPMIHRDDLPLASVRDQISSLCAPAIISSLSQRGSRIVTGSCEILRRRDRKAPLIKENRMRRRALPQVLWSAFPCRCRHTEKHGRWFLLTTVGLLDEMF